MYFGRLKADIWIFFEPRDIWVGMYVRKPQSISAADKNLFIHEIYVCIVPMFPVKFQWVGRMKK